MINKKRFNEICNENKLRGKLGEVEVYLLYRNNIVRYTGIARVTKRNWSRNRWRSHNNPNGKEYKDFDYFKVVEVTTEELEVQRENFYIKKHYDTCWIDNGGYNKCWSAGAVSDMTLKKMSESSSGEKHPMFGKKHSDETLKKMSDAHSGEKNHMFGRTGEKCPMFGMTGEKNHMFGKKHSDETLKKMSDAKSGEKSYMFGRTGAKHHNSKSVIGKNIKTGAETLYGSTREAGRAIGNKYSSHISKACREFEKTGKKLVRYGHYWRWATPEEVQEMAETRDNQE